jgi:16S rRNA (guanine1207-N2)-methyltransferase
MRWVTPIELDTLRRHPDVEAPELVAVDAADRLLLDTAASHLGDGVVAVINDQYGALTIGALQLRRGAGGTADGPPVRVLQDGLVHERALALNARALGLRDAYENHPLGDSLLDGVSTILLRLPRSLDELDEIAWWIATHAPAAVRVLAVGRVKHMSLSMNTVLGRYFGSVTADLARQKSRVLRASEPRPAGAPTFPRAAEHEVGLARPLQVRAFGATFGGAALDPGTRLLLPHLRALGDVDPERSDTRSHGRSDAVGSVTGVRGPRTDGSGHEAEATPPEVIDLGCGNGVISAAVALLHPTLLVHATDQSASAVASTTATAAANGVSARVRVTRDDALSAVPDASVRTIVLNPPFHLGSTVHTGIAHKLFRECARVLSPGGGLLVVWNSHLRYRPALERLVGPTVQLDRSPRFTVTRSLRR